MTRTIAGAKTSANASTLLAHHFNQAHRKPLNALKTTLRHTLLTRGLTHTLTHGFLEKFNEQANLSSDISSSLV